MDNVGRRNYADNNPGADWAVGLSARTSAAVEAAITSGAWCGWSSMARCPFRAERVPGASASKTRAGTKQGLASRSRFGLPARGGAVSDADTLPIADEAAASGRRPGAAAVRPFREQAHTEAERCCSRNARAFSTGSAGVSDCSRPGVDVGRAAASCDREVLDEVVAGLGASIMGVAAADGHRARRGWAGGETTRSCTR
jgi:hypothetical protein